MSGPLLHSAPLVSSPPSPADNTPAASFFYSSAHTKPSIPPAIRLFSSTSNPEHASLRLSDPRPASLIRISEPPHRQARRLHRAETHSLSLAGRLAALTVSDTTVSFQNTAPTSTTSLPPVTC